jgi:hypothetical protein
VRLNDLGSFVNSKIDRYNKLVDDINSLDLTQINKDRGIQLVNYPVCKEVNLWSCWEGGRKHLDASILLVGQDWGSLNFKGETIVRSMNSGTYDPNIFCYMDGNNSPTNRTICELFTLIDQRYQLDSDNNTYEDLFFTNFVPWYRAVNEKTSSGFKDNWIQPSALLFERLVDIIQPKVIRINEVLNDYIIGCIKKQAIT